jgi:chromate reductase, NAD(P)H dehydrogenase (quinone)
MTTLLLVPGSQRRESFNARLLRDIAARLVGRCTVDTLEPHEVDLPLFNQDLETDSSVVARVLQSYRRFEASHGIIVASPEYNGQPTPYLKNLIDWVSRLPHVDDQFENPFLDRPLLLCSASTGWSGGAAGMPHARALFAYVGCVLMGDSISVPHAAEAWTGNSFAFDPFFDAEIDGAILQILQLADAASGAKRQRIAAA